MPLSTDRPISYPSIRHLVPIPEEETADGVPLDQSAVPVEPRLSPLTQEDREELNFSDVDTFLRHVDAAPIEVYDSVMNIQKRLVLLDKQNLKLEKKFATYEKANEAYIFDNSQLKADNQGLETQLTSLETQLADQEKQLRDARSDKRPSPPSPTPSDDSDGADSKKSRSKKSTKLPDPPMLTDGHAAGFNINVWESKMVKKLTANANYYPSEALRMAYVDSRVDGEAYKHLAARSRIGARKLFTSAEEMFEVLQKAYGDVNRAHTTMNKFRDLRMTKDFNSFWVKFQVLASELDHNEATLIGELKHKLTPSLSRAMAGGVSRPKDIHKYVQQCQLTYQDLKNIELRTPAANFGANQYRETNATANLNAKTATGPANQRPANSVYSRPPSSASTTATRPIRSEATRLTRDKMARLQREDRCFNCKKVGDYRPRCTKEWRPMTALANTNPNSAALARVNVNKVAVPQPGHVIETENK